MNLKRAMDERALAVHHAAGHWAWVVTSVLLVVDMGLHGRMSGWLDWNGFPLDIPVILLAGATTRTVITWRAETLTPGRVWAKVAAIATGVLAAAALAWWFRQA